MSKTISAIPRQRRRTLRGLPDTRKRLVVARVSSIADAMKFIRLGHGITAASDDGALNVWQDKFGDWRCQFYRFLSCKDSTNCGGSMDKIRAWLNVYWPRMEEFHT